MESPRSRLTSVDELSYEPKAAVIDAGLILIDAEEALTVSLIKVSPVSEISASVTLCLTLKVALYSSSGALYIFPKLSSVSTASFAASDAVTDDLP